MILPGSKLTPRTPRTRIICIRHAKANCAVIAFDAMALKLFGQSMMRAIIFGHNQQAAGIFVNAMHDPWPLFTANSRQAVGAMEQKRIDQCIPWATPAQDGQPCPRVCLPQQHHHLRRQSNWGILCDSLNLVGFGHRLFQLLVSTTLAFVSVYRQRLTVYCTFGQKLRQLRPRKICRLWHITRKRFIKAFRRISLNKECDNGRQHQGPSG